MQNFKNHVGVLSVYVDTMQVRAGSLLLYMAQNKVHNTYILIYVGISLEQWAKSIRSKWVW